MIELYQTDTHHLYLRCSTTTKIELREEYSQNHAYGWPLVRNCAMGICNLTT